MVDKKSLQKLIPSQGILPLFFYKDPAVCIEVLKTLYRAEIRVVEFTNRGNSALDNFKEMRKICDQELPGLALGIGTIKNAEMAKIYIDAGADFIVSPGIIEEVARVADKYEMFWIPGCMTPSEIIQGENLGAKIIKLFPGNIIGPEFMSAIKPLFPDLLFMPTGGVDLDEANLSGWFHSGVCAVGMGSKLISSKLLKEKNYHRIGGLTQEVVQIIKELKFK